MCLFEVLADWMGDGIGVIRSAMFKGFARQWNNAEEAELRRWIWVFQDRQVRNEPTRDTYLGPLAKSALKMVMTYSQEQLNVLL